jgi:hypothetical protein
LILLMKFYLNPVCFETILCAIPIPWPQLRLPLWSGMWLILIKVQRALETQVSAQAADSGVPHTVLGSGVLRPYGFLPTGFLNVCHWYWT